MAPSTRSAAGTLPPVAASGQQLGLSALVSYTYAVQLVSLAHAAQHAACAATVSPSGHMDERDGRNASVPVAVPAHVDGGRTMPLVDHHWSGPHMAFFVSS